MARKPRLDLPGVAQHIVQRGNDRQPCFFAAGDYERYRHDLRQIASNEGCAVHAYVLMTNHVHLLMTPAQAGSVARFMQALGRRYVRYVNDRYDRTGTLWEGRYRACLVDSAAYLLSCYRYIELNPVRAAMVADPANHAWSSFHANALGIHDPLVQPHPSYQALGADTEERRATYRSLVMASVDDEEIEAIRRHLQRQHAFGSPRFRDAIESQLGRLAGPAKIGRPRKTPLTRESAL